MKKAVNSNVLVFDGMHSKVIALDALSLAIKLFPIKLEYNALKEYELLQILNKSGIECVPKIYGLVKTENAVLLVKSYIKGEYFYDFLEERDIKEIADVLKKLIMCLHKIDKIGVIIKELSSPRKNIIISDGKPFIIDLERWVREAKKTNITQFLGFIYKATLRNDKVGSKLRAIINTETILETARKYKEKMEVNEIPKKIFKK